MVGRKDERRKLLAAQSSETRRGLSPREISVLREAHDGRFYYAAITVAPRRAELALDFLGVGDWEMSVFADDPTRTPSDACAIRLERRPVRKGGHIAFDLQGEGGAVAIFRRR